MNYKKVFLLAFLVKALWFALTGTAFYKNKPNNGKEVINYIVAPSKDMVSYLVPIENLVNTGQYFYYNSDAGTKSFANRMPGMLPIYGPLYFLFGKGLGMTTLILLQFFADVLSVVMITWISFYLFKKVSLAWLTALIYAASVYVSLYTHYPISETFCTFFIISAFFFYFLSQHKQERQLTYLLLSGLCITWAVFFRPASGILIMIMPLALLLDFIFKRNTRLLKPALLIVLPFIFFETAWIVRNYKVTNRFIALDTSGEDFLYSEPHVKAMFRLVSAIGGDIQRWIPESESNWFLDERNSHYNTSNKNNFPFPKCMFLSGKITKENMYELRDIFNSDMQNDSLKNEFVKKSDSIRNIFIAENPFYYYGIAPFKILPPFLFIERPYNYPFTSSSLYDKLMRLAVVILYYVVFILGMVGLFFFLKPGHPAFSIVLFVFLHITVYALIFRLAENRYLVPAFPFMAIGCSYFISLFLKKQIAPK